MGDVGQLMRGEERRRAVQAAMAARSYAWPSAAMTGSRMAQSVMGQTNCGGGARPEAAASAQARSTAAVHSRYEVGEAAEGVADGVGVAEARGPLGEGDARSVGVGARQEGAADGYRWAGGERDNASVLSIHSDSSWRASADWISMCCGCFRWGAGLVLVHLSTFEAAAGICAFESLGSALKTRDCKSRPCWTVRF